MGRSRLHQTTAVLGGTFDRLHVGHLGLLRTAFASADRVAIGLTTAGYLAHHVKPGAHRIQPYALRRRALVHWLGREHPEGGWVVVPLGDGFGRSVQPGFDVLVVTDETLAGARRVNAERRRRGLGRLRIVRAPIVLADDLEPVSSRRIRAGIIDREGRRRAAIRISLRLAADALVPRWRAALRERFPQARFLPVRHGGARYDLEISVRSGGSRHARLITLRSPATRLRPRSISATETPRAVVARLWPARRRETIRPTSR